MKKENLVNIIKSKKSFLCVGLDSDPTKIPSCLNVKDDPVFEFNKRIIDATLPYAVAYKPNIAFYESSGSEGWKSLEKTMNYIKSLNSEVFTIADAKRGDIGNSAAHYAKAFFEKMDFDAITVSPYMGYDSIEPFLAYEDKWAIILALTSNVGSVDFQVTQFQLPYLLEKLGIKTCYGKSLYELVIEKSLTWSGSKNIMFVVGATQSGMIKNIREIAGDSFLLVPGVGAQGGSLREVSANGMTSDCGLLVNASRSIIFASGEKDFDKIAAREALKLQKEMEILLREREVI
ncbi:MAG: orotidine-5'-phosphate decarboxylase [Bacteroidetes bacterium]|nr:MAG: orotidine-5'-phosphate decarboxylase [Bacteroidota bacterium]